MQNLVLWLVRASVALVVALFSVGVYAHNTNKVVVIPMGGDPPPLKAVTPIAPVDTSQSNYIINVLTVVDKVTGLEWQRVDDDVTRTRDQAFDYCDDLNGTAFAGKTHWRLPSVTELQSIVDYGSSFPAIEAIAFTGTNTNLYWTTSSIANNVGRGWTVNFNGGGNGNIGKTVNSYARCVR